MSKIEQLVKLGKRNDKMCLEKYPQLYLYHLFLGELPHGEYVLFVPPAVTAAGRDREMGRQWSTQVIGSRREKVMLVLGG